MHTHTCKGIFVRLHVCALAHTHKRSGGWPLCMHAHTRKGDPAERTHTHTHRGEMDGPFACVLVHTYTGGWAAYWQTRSRTDWGLHGPFWVPACRWAGGAQDAAPGQGAHPRVGGGGSRPLDTGAHRRGGGCRAPWHAHTGSGRGAAPARPSPAMLGQRGWSRRGPADVTATLTGPAGLTSLQRQCSAERQAPQPFPVPGRKLRFRAPQPPPPPPPAAATAARAWLRPLTPPPPPGAGPATLARAGAARRPLSRVLGPVAARSPIPTARGGSGGAHREGKGAQGGTSL